MDALFGSLDAFPRVRIRFVRFSQDSGVAEKVPRHWIVFRILNLSPSYISSPEQLIPLPKSAFEMDALFGSLDAFPRVRIRFVWF